MAGTQPESDLLERGQKLAMQGRHREAEDVLREALALVRGTDTLAESRACGNLGSLFGIAGRRLEAILLYRRGLAVARTLEIPRLEALHLSNLASMLVVLGLWRHLERTFEELDRVAARLPAEGREALTDLALWPRASLAIHEGKLVEGRRLWARFSASVEGRSDSLARVTRVALEADLLRREGRADDALRVLEAFEQPEDAQPIDDVYLTCLRLESLEALGREDERRETAARTLDRLPAIEEMADIGELPIELTTDLARCLEDQPEHAERACRAYDLAASIVLARIAALEGSVQFVPELAELSEEDQVWLSDLREGWRRDQERLLHRVGALLRERSETQAAFLYAGGPSGTLVRLCAWCGRIGTRSQVWLPLAHFIPDDRDLRVTHCICPSCSRRALQGEPAVPPQHG